MFVYSVSDAKLPVLADYSANTPSLPVSTLEPMAGIGTLDLGLWTQRVALA